MAFIRHAPNGSGRRHNGGHNGGNSGHSNTRPRYNNQGGYSAGQNSAVRKPSSRLNQVFDSNGPDARVRGTALQIVEKYGSLARDAQSMGDRVLAQSYQQHAEHYQRLHNEIQDEHAAIEAERNAWRQQQQEQQQSQQQDQQQAESLENNGSNSDNSDANQADMLAHNGERHQQYARAPRQNRPENRSDNQRPQNQPTRYGDQPTMAEQELPSFLSIPIRAPKAPMLKTPAAALSEAPTAASTEATVTPRARRIPLRDQNQTAEENQNPSEAVVTRPRRKATPVITTQDE